MVVNVEVLDKDTIVLRFSGIANSGSNELYSIEVGLANLLALLRRIATLDRRAVINIERWRICSRGRVCESACNQSQRGEDACQEHVVLNSLEWFVQGDGRETQCG